MTLAESHLSPVLTIPLVVMIAVVLGWYWRRLGLEDVPSSRRNIRRLSLAIMLLSLSAFVRGLSFLDPAVQRREYLIAWLVAIMLVVLVAILAVIDAANNSRIHRHMRHQQLHEATEDLVAAIKDRQRSRMAFPTRSSKGSPNGESAQ